MALGNGMRAEVWEEFLRRFGPVDVREFYGATEGNAGFINYTGKVGAVGRANRFLKLLAPFELIRYDVDEDAPARDRRGLCVPVAPGETGLLVVKITKNTPFHGYAGDARKTEKKILRDVLAKGDAFFNSGDLLMVDRRGLRLLPGPSRGHVPVNRDAPVNRDVPPPRVLLRDGPRPFRVPQGGKGRNVATTEVEAALGSVSFIQEVNVYGVAVPASLWVRDVPPPPS
ncbi:hypothetical protein DUI87_00362 [Hirundo rustica rustica]|uniref:Uncharacterized protein n=1 Tax=Hirundo rustica rustica TaxID=333673 RepID=A0A3M0LB52_HIRRU|nr:hypothetical protein DUI87_00362 [Hirundo rustica rustica]